MQSIVKDLNNYTRMTLYVRGSVQQSISTRFPDSHVDNISPIDNHLLKAFDLVLGQTGIPLYNHLSKHYILNKDHSHNHIVHVCTLNVPHGIVTDI